VVTAETGEEAIEYYESKKEEIIDMVILDLDMPGMGGLSGLRSSSN
jgi:CheY-like chemotaxis protein